MEALHGPSRTLVTLTRENANGQTLGADRRPRGDRSIPTEWRVEVQKRVQYSAPRLTAHGSVEKITKGLSVGHNIDAAFPRGTPIDQLSFT
jgi:hypothetical protein